MIYFFTPKKTVPTWLAQIKVGEIPSFPRHGGWGLVVQKNGYFLVYLLSGHFITFEPTRKEIHITGQGKGICVLHTFLKFFLMVFCNKPTLTRIVNSSGPSV